MPGPVTTRQKLIAAAGRVYAAAGYRGATTRRIAEVAGVNEVTIFRLFGSKAALIDELLQQSSDTTPDALGALPAVPVDPQKELTAWSEMWLAEMSLRRRLIRQMLGDMAEKPEMSDCASRGPYAAVDELRRYVKQLRRHGFLDSSPGTVRGRNEEEHAAVAMLMAALFSDAISRDMMPSLYPQPAGKAPPLYVRLFLRALHFRESTPPVAGLTPAARISRKTGATTTRASRR